MSKKDFLTMNSNRSKLKEDIAIPYVESEKRQNLPKIIQQPGEFNIPKANLPNFRLEDIVGGEHKTGESVREMKKKPDEKAPFKELDIETLF